MSLKSGSPRFGSFLLVQIDVNPWQLKKGTNDNMSESLHMGYILECGEPSKPLGNKKQTKSIQDCPLVGRSPNLNTNPNIKLN